MRVITFGRLSSNDVVINDPLVTREFHMKLYILDDGRYKVVDGSKNGTFVNGRKIPGESFINRGDIIRIGNTTVPWENYINGQVGGDNGGHTVVVPTPSPPPAPESSNGMAIAGFVCSFFFPLLGIIFSAIGLSRANKSVSKKGKGLAIAGLIISIVMVVIVWLIYAMVIGVIAGTTVY